MILTPCLIFYFRASASIQGAYDVSYLTKSSVGDTADIFRSRKGILSGRSEQRQKKSPFLGARKEIFLQAISKLLSHQFTMDYLLPDLNSQSFLIAIYSRQYWKLLPNHGWVFSIIFGKLHGKPQRQSYDINHSSIVPSYHHDSHTILCSFAHSPRRHRLGRLFHFGQSCEFLSFAL